MGFLLQATELLNHRAILVVQPPGHAGRVFLERLGMDQTLPFDDQGRLLAGPESGGFEFFLLEAKQGQFPLPSFLPAREFGPPFAEFPDDRRPLVVAVAE